MSIICADVLDWCESYSGPPFHAILCDPSYALSKKKRLDMDAPVDAEIETVGDVIAAYHALQQWGDVGFMNREWDSSVAFDPRTWRALARHLHPGGFIMAFASSRGDHRLAVAMEDAGLIIHPKIFCWAQGQGFCKATRIDTQIDKMLRRDYVKAAINLGLEIPNNSRWDWTKGEHIPSDAWWEKFKTVLSKKDWQAIEREVVATGRCGQGAIFGSANGEYDITAPATDLARAWQGHRYGLQALKPAVEPILVAQKPYSGKPVECIVETGAGALWIDGGRVAGPGWSKQDRESGGGFKKDKFMGSVGLGEHTQQHCLRQSTSGRWPPNFALCHMPPVLVCQQCQAVHPIQPVIECCPGCGGELERVEGCRRVGVKRVRGSRIEKPCDYSGDAGMFGNDGDRPARGIGDPDGLETVAAYACAEGCPARRLGEMSGQRKSGALTRSETARAEAGKHGIYGHFDGCPDGKHFPASEGTAARFYPQASWEHEEMECCESCPVARLDEQAGERPSSARPQSAGKFYPMDNQVYGEFDGKNHCSLHDDSGGVSRYYPNANWQHEVAEQLAQADPVRYVPKAAKKERSSGLDDFYWRRDKGSPTGFVRVSKEEWEALDKRQRARGNIHPTVKPIALLKWLATLLLPPPEYAPRRILIPFCGTFSEGLGAMLAGWEEITAIEWLQDYVDIGKARRDWWLEMGRQMEMPL